MLKYAENQLFWVDKNMLTWYNSYYEKYPKNWTDTTLEAITKPKDLTNGSAVSNGQTTDTGGIKLIQPSSIGKMKFLGYDCKYVSEETFEESGFTEIKGGYLIINRIINDGMKACILPLDEGKAVTSADVCRVAPSERYSVDYLLCAVSSPDFQREVYKNSGGAMLKRINKSSLAKIPFALPPLEEQRRIASAVYSIFERLDRLITN